MNLPQLPLAPNDSASLWTTRNSRTRITGTWRTRAPEYRSTAAPCLAACPVNGTIARWIGEVRAGNLRRAWELLVENNPFPAIAGPVKVDGARPPLRAAPALGADTEAILGELGYGAAEIADLRRRGVA